MLRLGATRTGHFDTAAVRGKAGSWSQYMRKRNKPFHEPWNKHAAPTELEEGPRDVGGYRHGAPTELEEGPRDVGSYRHGAPTELCKPVQSPSGCAKQKEAF